VNTLSERQKGGRKPRELRNLRSKIMYDWDERERSKRKGRRCLS